MIIASRILHPHGAASALHSGTHWFAIGLLIGLVVAATPAIVKVPVIVFDIVALGWSFGILHYADTGNGRWVLVGVAFLLIGLWFGATRGLKMLGEHEFLTRRSGMKARGMWLR